MNDQHDDNIESEGRRKALRAIGKYATLGAGASVVLLSSAEAVKAAPNSKACEKNKNC
ncbi:hypothetical protein [Tropicibacter oceani]|uniref:Uncharacterized protein n=1 Tax=Tropicibacter oceani TaxID=3058420 RepID=A0ABY8QH53_9RHOB|nr:hypothetical protein [Tropicibacter oceani]WGW03308.1 hypothetical protein QF118_15455 [Tropicibacter oceani]